MDRSGNVLEPVVGANYEVGSKGEFFNKRLNTAAAIFRLEQINLAETDRDFGISPICDDWYCSYASGKVISEGVDLSVNGALSSNWNVGAGYTYLKSEYATGEEKGGSLWNPDSHSCVPPFDDLPDPRQRLDGGRQPAGTEPYLYRGQGTKGVYPRRADGEIPDQRPRGTQHHRR
jgi:outer membrane receptor for ferric coprogen and ferric-rhodotorulic acid